MVTLFEALRGRGWNVRLLSRPHELLPSAIAARYAGVPSEVLQFLAATEICCSEDGTTWFLTAEDYARVDGPQFRWNECELMALETAAGDVEWQRNIRGFWDRHFPFMLAVHSDYDYLAVSLDSGGVVHGYAPYWETPSPIAASFSEFVHIFGSEVASVQPRWPYSVFAR